MLAGPLPTISGEVLTYQLLSDQTRRVPITQADTQSDVTPWYDVGATSYHDLVSLIVANSSGSDTSTSW